MMFPSLTLLTNDILRGWTGVEEPPENVPDDTRYYITAKTIRLLTAQFRAALWYKDNFEIITSELAAYKRQYGIVVAIAKDNVAEVERLKTATLAWQLITAGAVTVGIIVYILK